MSPGIEELKQLKHISERASNVLAKRNISTIEELVAFYRDYGTFEVIPQCGKKTNQELISLSQKYSDKVEIDQNEMSSGASIELDSTTPILDKIVNNLFERMSRREQKELYDDLRGDLSFAKASNRYFGNHDNDFIKNIDKSPDRNFHRFIQTVADLTEIQNYFRNTFPEALELGVWAYIEFGIKIHNIPALKKDCRERSIRLFRLIDILINEGNKFNDKWKTVFYLKSSFIQHDEDLALEEIGQQLGVTRERVRQIAVKVDNDFIEAISPLTKFSTLLLIHNKYEISKDDDLIYLTQREVEKINQIEKVQFSQSGYIHIFNIFYNNKYYHIKSDRNKFPSFLVRRELSDFFPFEQFQHQIYDVVTDSIERDTVLKLDKLLSQYNIYPDSPKGQKVREICQYIILDAFGEYVYKDKIGNLIIRQNTIISIKDAIKEILHEYQRPLHLDELIPLVARRRNIKSSPETIRHIVNKSEAFIAFGRTSTYGLAEWEDTMKGIKGGPIRDMIIEYLNQQPEPVYIFEILNHLWKFRPTTTETSVTGNLQQDNRKRFVHIKHGYWGLSDKNYKTSVLDEIESIPNRFTTVLKNTLLKNESMPIDQLVRYMTSRYQLSPSRVKTHLHNLSLRGDIKITADGRVTWII